MRKKSVSKRVFVRKRKGERERERGGGGGDRQTEGESRCTRRGKS